MAFPPPSPPLERDELQALWGKELYLGGRFAEEGDWYRAITAFKSSLFLLPKKEEARKQQIEFYLFLSYFLAGRYQEACETYENSSLIELNLETAVGPSQKVQDFESELLALGAEHSQRVKATPNPSGSDSKGCAFGPAPPAVSRLKEGFSAKRELCLALWECYHQTGQEDKALLIQQRLKEDDQQELNISKALQEGDLFALQSYALERPAIDQLLEEYHASGKSVRRAETLQALLPGAGYWYVGLKKTALTSLIINALFIAAAAEFWHHGYYAASLITLSLETGWYFGGINGAGLAANEYNERLYENLGKEVLHKERLFPILKFECVF